jgi:ATP-dependent DNA helicase PIF1
VRSRQNGSSIGPSNKALSKQISSQCMDVDASAARNYFSSYSPSSVLGVGSLLLTVFVVHCMLVRRPASKATARLASAPSLNTTTTYSRGRASLPRRNPLTFESKRTYTYAAMLRAAAHKHEQENQTVLSKTLSQSLFPSSPPTPTSSKPLASKSVSAGFQNVLRPSQPSAANAMRAPPPRQNVGGIKRTASGLAKAFDSVFEEDSGSQNRPIVLGGNSPAKIAPTDLFGEDDFDSDIDLDVEEPIAKGTVSYPNLAKSKPAPAPAPMSKPIVYPTLPRQQQARTGSSMAYQDSGYGSVEPRAKEVIPGSSNPLPWSSSPLEHFQPTRDPSTISQFTYNGGQSARTPPTTAAEPKVAKRRIPWLEEKDTESAGAYASYQSIGEAMRPISRDMATPASKTNKKSQFPWNTTASAVKDQQKKHREEVKKAVKKNEGTDESILKAKTKAKKVARVFLSEEQQHVLDLVVEKKKAVFFTGSAGTGKSVLLREIISSLRKKYAREPDRIAVTASTGLAACNVGGVTLHSFAGIGLGKEPAIELVKKIKKNQKARHRWMRTKVLVVDEISMVDGELFDKLESIARTLRNNGRPFGGIQLVITGDFFQLPPVPDKGKIAQFAFDASTWTTAVEYTIGLHHVFRQKDPGKCYAGIYSFDVCC